MVRFQFLCRHDSALKVDCTSTTLHPSYSYGTVARWKLWLNKGHLTACLESAKWHLKDSSSMGSKHSLVFWDKNLITCSECRALQLAKPGSMHSILNVSPRVRHYEGSKKQGFVGLLLWNLNHLWIYNINFYLTGHA